MNIYLFMFRRKRIHQQNNIPYFSLKILLSISYIYIFNFKYECNNYRNRINYLQ